jgi:hypothetical protein
MNKLILVEGTIDFKIINKKLFDNDSTVISFDYLSHKSLNDNNIEHKLVEEYFLEEDKNEIDKLTLKFATTWYKDEKIRKYIEFEKINLGSLLELEMPDYFFKILKRIIGIKNIIEKENPNQIISYSLKKYVEYLCKNKNIELNSFEKIIPTGLFFDKIEIPLNIVFIKKNIKISRKNYFKIKNTIDHIINFVWKIKLNKKLLMNKDSILLLEFNTKLYEDFLKSFKISDKNIIILNQRRPSIWNRDTLKIIKNSKCGILSINDFKNNQTKNKTLLEKNELLTNLKLLQDSENVLKIIFTHNQESFWNIIKHEFLKMITERFQESIERLILINEMFNQINVKVILDWAHTGVEEKEINHHAIKKKIAVYCLQHGIMTLNSKLEKYLPLMPVLPSKNVKMLVWGKTMESYVLDHKINPEKISIVGSPRHDRFFKKNISNNSNTILIASNLFFHYNFEGNDTRAYDRFELYLKEILKYIKKNSNKKPIIKLHQSEYFQISSIIKKIDSTIPIYQHEDILELIETSDTVISLNYSTILLDALILNKPTMVILPEKQNYEEEEIIRKNAVLAVSNISELEIKLKQILLDNNIRNNLILNGKQFINEYFSFQGNSSKILSEFLLNINKN